jgi:uncharacterized membrane protein
VSWNVRFVLRQHLRGALWPVPFASALGGLLAAAIMWRLDEWGRWALLGYRPAGATALTAAVVGTMITFIGIIFSALLMAVQFASAQLTPRALKESLNDPVTKAALGTFMATFVYALVVIARIRDDFVPQLALAGVIVLAVLSLSMFLGLVSHVGHALRPANVAALIGRLGRRTLALTYREPVARSAGNSAPSAPPRHRAPPRIVVNDGPPGLVLACDVAALVTEARRVDARLELVPAVGDFVPRGAPVFRAFEADAAVDDRWVSTSVALGQERTVTEDPIFAFRILVDMAIKALSPAINDPTSAIMALDQLHDLLRFVAGRRLDVGEHRDAAGVVRLTVEMPTWEVYVSLTVDEIRQYGATSVQVARRLKSLLVDVIEVAPKERQRAVQEELTLLARTVDRAFPDLEDRGRASVGDRQGLGSSPPPGGGSGI